MRMWIVGLVVFLIACWLSMTISETFLEGWHPKNIVKALTDRIKESTDQERIEQTHKGKTPIFSNFPKLTRRHSEPQDKAKELTDEERKERNRLKGKSPMVAKSPTSTRRQSEPTG